MDVNDEAIYRLVTATNQLDGSYYLYARRLGAKENALALLYALSDGEPHSQKQVSQEWLIPKTTVNTIIKEWEQQGYAALGEARAGRRPSSSPRRGTPMPPACWTRCGPRSGPPWPPPWSAFPPNL